MLLGFLGCGEDRVCHRLFKRMDGFPRFLAYGELMTTPKKLYKYCPINVWSLRAISEAEVHHSSPALFNDPLDCNPTLEVDVSNSHLEMLLRSMMAWYNSPEAIDKEIRNIRYMANAPTMEDEEQLSSEEELKWGLSSRISRILKREFGEKGVLSLSESWAQPLMWSHYADEHKGICIEYDVSKWPVMNLKPVNYNSPRAVRAHDLYRWKVEGDETARQRVYDTYFYSKAPDWHYEKEWRDVHDKAGVNTLSFEITAIYFGMRMDFVWQRAFGKMLNQDRDITLYQITAQQDSFGLSRNVTERDEIDRMGIRQPPFKVFGNILDTTTAPTATSGMLAVDVFAKNTPPTAE